MRKYPWRAQLVPTVLAAMLSHPGLADVPRLKGAVRAASCETIADDALRAAVAEARAEVLAPWLDQASHHVAAYTLAGEPANPLLPNKAEGKGQITGLVRITALACELTSKPGKTPATVAFVATGVRFSEAGAPWTPPLPKGALAEVRFIRNADGRWVHNGPINRERSFLPPDARLSLPSPGSIANSPQ